MEPNKTCFSPDFVHRIKLKTIILILFESTTKCCCFFFFFFWFKLVVMPIMWLFCQLTLTRMRNQLDANVLILLCPYVVQQQPMVMASLNRLANRSTLIYYHSHRLASNTLMVKNVLSCKMIIKENNNN